MPVVTATARPSALSIFGNRSFALLWTGQLISTAGSALTTLAAAIVVYRQTDSALDVGLLYVAAAVPSLMIGLVAGVFVDRYDRRRVMLAADLGRAVLVALIPVLLPYGLGWLYVLVALSSAVGQFFDPAQASVLPEIAPDEQLAAANALMQISVMGSSAIGFAASGLLTAHAAAGWAFALNGLSYAASAACIALTRLPSFVADTRTTVAAVTQNLRAGLAYLFDTPILRSLFITAIPASLGVGLLNAVLLPLVLRSLHSTTAVLGLIEALSAAGFVAGALVMVRLGDRLHDGQWIALSYIAVGVVCVAIGLASSAEAAAILYCLGGFLNAPNYVGRGLVVQRHTRRDLRGRVSSAFLVTRNALMLAGMAATGLADLYGPRAVYTGGALVVLAAGLLVLVLPGLGQPAAEWRHAVALLRSANLAPELGLGRAATAADLDTLAALLPALESLGAQERRDVVAHTRVHQAPAGAAIVRQGDASDAAYFILAGRAVAGRAGEGTYRSLETLQAGDFFGEIAALTGAPRTASVISEGPITVLQVPATTLRQLMTHTFLNRLLLSRMAERLVRMNMIDLPGLAPFDQQALRELRTAQPTQVPLGSSEV